MERKKLLFVIAAGMVVSSCNCGSSSQTYDMKPVQKTDKQLSCKDIVLEINEAEFYKKAAKERKQGRIEDVIFPYCYPTGYLSANNTEKTSESRLEYLNQIYDLLDCDAKARFESRKLPAPITTYQDVTPPVTSSPVPPPHSTAPAK